ncbi:KxYKxGKxW signal peptide domain-containing protein [Levilactobacillus spicheri]
MFETKVHYKSYKAGKQWLYMAIGVTSLCAGLALTVPANAATNAADASDSTTVVQADSSSDSAGSSQPAGDDSEQPASATEESKTDQTAAGQDESAQPGNDQESGEDTANQSNGTASSDGVANADQSSTESHQEKSASDSSTIAPVTESTPVTTPDADTDSQTTEPTDVMSSADMTAPLTSKDSTTNNQTIGVNNQDTSLTATYQITNQTDTGQGLWITFDLPAYANHDTGIVMAGDADVSALESQIPQGVQLNYITIDGSKYRSAAGLDLSTVRQLQLTGTLAAGGSYTATVPLVITSKGATETATLSVHDFTPDWSGSTLYLQAMDPVLPNTPTDLPTPTTPDAVTTIDPTVTTPVTAITNNPNGSEVTDTAPVDASVRLTATNQNGTATSFSTSNDLETYTAAIVDANATDLTALMDLTNQTDTVQVVNTYFSLPNYYTSLNSSLTSQITMSDDADVQAMLATVPSGLHVNFVVGNTSYASYEALMAANPDFHWSSLTQFHVTGYLAGQSGYTLNVPLTVQTNDEYTSQGVSILSQYSFGAVTTNGALHFKVATPRDPVVGQYEAIVADPDDDGYDYEIAPTEVQEAMPSVGQDQVAYYNYYDQGGHATNYSSTTFFNGGTVTVDWKKAGIADALKDLG